MKKVRWGILSTAKIGREKVIPAMQQSPYADVAAIASRDIDQAKKVAAELHIAKVYGSYEALLNDPEIDAVYIPLPNDLHVPWAIKAMAAGKHVLCEKPIALSAMQAAELLEVSEQHPNIKVMEAFMYRFHPQWAHVKQLIERGAIGELKSIQSHFSYYNVDPNNIRNKKNAGGGGLMDIGCYCISISRFIFGKEPLSVFGAVQFDANTHTDNYTSGILDFGNGTSTFTCSTQLVPTQYANILGTTARIEMEIPFTPLPDKPARIWLHSKTGTEEISFEAVNQYTLQASLFSLSILNNTPVPTPLQDAVNNMKVIDAVFKSGEEGKWVTL
jgi:predicted dehydrogenase